MEHQEHTRNLSWMLKFVTTSRYQPTGIIDGDTMNITLDGKKIMNVSLYVSANSNLS